MAAGDVLKREGSPITFGSAGGETVTMTMAALVDGAGRQSAQYDLETALGQTRTNFFKLRAEFRNATNGNNGSAVKVYIKRSNGTTPDNSEGLTDSAATEAKQRNCLRAGDAIVDGAASATETFVLAVDELLIPDPFIQMVVINKTGQTLGAAANLKITLTPIIYQGQLS